MGLISLTPEEREQLGALLGTLEGARVIRRINAIVALEEADSIERVADKLGMSRTTVYRIMKHFLANRSKPAIYWVTDDPRIGRPEKPLTAKGEYEQYLKLLRRLFLYEQKHFGYTLGYDRNDQTLKIEVFKGDNVKDVIISHRMRHDEFRKLGLPFPQSLIDFAEFLATSESKEPRHALSGETFSPEE